MNSSPVEMPSRAGGIRDVVWTEANDFREGNVGKRKLATSSSKSGGRSSPVEMPSRGIGIDRTVDDDVVGSDEMIRDKIVSLRATSKPFRSSAG